MISVLIPFYSDGARLERTLSILKSARSKYPISQILLAHNGPAMSQDQRSRLQNWSWEEVTMTETPTPGVGAGCKVAIPQATGKYILITGSDLPFGFTDLEGFLENLKMDPELKVAIGSKGHPDSNIAGNSLARKLMSQVFLFLRRILLHRKSPADTQGSIFLETQMAKRLCSDCYIDNYLFTMEIVTRAQRSGAKVIEVPVNCDMQEGGGSSVKVLRDSIKSLIEIFKFSMKLRSKGA